MTKISNEEIMTALTLDPAAWIKHWLPEINDNQAKLLIRYINGLRVNEINKYADFLSEFDDQVVFEEKWQEFAYRRIRDIDAEE